MTVKNELARRSSGVKSKRKKGTKKNVGDSLSSSCRVCCDLLTLLNRAKTVRLPEYWLDSYRTGRAYGNKLASFSSLSLCIVGCICFTANGLFALAAFVLHPPDARGDLVGPFPSAFPKQNRDRDHCIRHEGGRGINSRAKGIQELDQVQRY